MIEFLQSVFQRLPFGFRRRFGSLRTLLIFWNAVSLALLMGSLGLAVHYITLSYMKNSVDAELLHSIERYQHELRARPGSRIPPPPNSDNPDPLPPEGPDVPRPERRDENRPPPRPPRELNAYSPRLYYLDLKPEFRRDTQPILDAIAFARAAKGEKVYVNLEAEGVPVRVLYAPGRDRSEIEGVAQSAHPMTEVYRAMTGIDTSLMLLLPVGLLGAIWLGFALTNRILRRMQGMTQAAGRIGAQDISQRLPVSGEDEFSQLAVTFNEMLGRLDVAFQEQKRVLESQRRFIADASHELKTPLTIIKGSSSLALNRVGVDEKSLRVFRKIDETADSMSQLVQDLLLLAQVEEGSQMRRPIEMLAQEALERGISEAAEAGSAKIKLSIEPAQLTLYGKEVELIRLFRNLMENALKYTPPEGEITVEASLSEGGTLVKIRDTGSGVAPEHLPSLGERFYRVDGSRTRPTGGTGLGLSICRQIVEAHGGTLTFESEVGVGTTVSVCLPNVEV